jgi:hypothetical protein
MPYSLNMTSKNRKKEAKEEEDRQCGVKPVAFGTEYE